MSAAAWERLSRQASAAVSTCDDLLAEIDGWLSEIPCRPVQHRGREPGAEKMTLRASQGGATARGLDGGPWPRQFPTREAWLAWCEEDRRDEALEILLDANPWA